MDQWGIMVGIALVGIAAIVAVAWINRPPRAALDTTLADIVGTQVQTTRYTNHSALEPSIRTIIHQHYARHFPGARAHFLTELYLRKLENQLRKGEVLAVSAPAMDFARGED